MKIIAQDTSRLIAEDTNTKSVTFGVCLIIIGIILISIGIKDALTVVAFVGGSFLIVGIIASLTSKKYHTVVDLSLGTVTVATSSVIGSSQLVKPLSEITTVRVFETLSSSGRQHNGALQPPAVLYQIQLVLTNGEAIPLEKFNRKSRTSITIAGVALPIHDQSRAAALTPAQTIAQFLNIPLEESGPGSTLSNTFLGSA